MVSENLYKAFSVYELKPRFSDRWDQNRVYDNLDLDFEQFYNLRTVPLEYLNIYYEEMYTCGDNEDFLYLLPRILESEIWLQEAFHAPLEYMFKKTDFLNWKESERKVVIDYLQERFYSLLTNGEFTAYHYSKLLKSMIEEFGVEIEFDELKIRTALSTLIDAPATEEQGGKIYDFLSVVLELPFANSVLGLLPDLFKNDVNHLLNFSYFLQRQNYFFEIVNAANLDWAIKYRKALEDAFSNAKNEEEQRLFSDAEYMMSLWIKGFN